MKFRDRREAGALLAKELERYGDREQIVIIGLPRGGVPIAYEVARSLGAPLDIVCPRKVGAPMNKEYAIGAITETGEGIFDQNAIAGLQISKDYIVEEVKRQQAEARHRLDVYRAGLPPRDLKGRTVVIVDDGLATGSTMKAAIQSVKAEGASEIIVAVPVAPRDTLEEIATMVDDVVCLYVPYEFHAVGEFYQDFRSTEDEEVVELMRHSRS